MNIHLITGAFHPNATDAECLAQARIDVSSVFGGADTVCDWENVRYGRDSRGNKCAFVPVVNKAHGETWRNANGQYVWM